jgi:hypothetical protein
MAELVYSKHWSMAMIGRRAGNLSIAGAAPRALATLYFVAIGAMVVQAAPSDNGGAKNPVDALYPYQVEWVYRVKWGHDEEFWKIFKATQIPVLDREKQLGYVLGYKVYKPGLHTSEELRWNYRIVIIYKDILSSTHGGELEKQLFPDQAAYAKEENQRWELVLSHYDLPIKEIDAHADN